MGCGASSVTASNVVVSNSNQAPAQFPAQFPPGPNQGNQGFGDTMNRNSRLNMIEQALLADDVATVSQCLQFVRPYENVKTDGRTNISCLHEAAYNNAEKSLEVYAQWLRNNEPNQILAHIDTLDSNRATVAMAAITNNSAEALYVILCQGLIGPDHIVMGKNMAAVCQQHSRPCLMAINRFRSRGQPNQDVEWNEWKKTLNPVQEEPVPAPEVNPVNEEKVSKEEKWDEEAFKRKMEQRRKEDEEWERQQAIKREEERKRQEEQARLEDEANQRQALQPAVSTTVTKDIYATMSKGADGRYHVRRTEGNLPNWGDPLDYENKVICLKNVPAKSEMELVITELADGHVNLYIDAQFETIVDSLTKDSSHNYYQMFSEAEWKRPDVFLEAELNSKAIQVFDKISPNDISQGVLGVCYMLSSLAAIAEYPQRMQKIFLNTFVNKWGAYGVKYYIRGIPTEVIVDDRFPCKKGTNQPLFSKPKGKELWVMIAEKAWAKIYKSYAACEHGYIHEALEYLTGAPSSYHAMKPEDSDDKIFSKIHDADQKKYIMCAASKSTATKASGMVADHAYSVISAHDVDGHKVLKLRNPWGKFEWNGDFSDNSSVWTPELKTKLGYVSEDDGVFFMSLKDFRNNFESFSINHYHDDWLYSFTKAEAEPKHAQYYTIMVDKPTSVYFRLHFEDSRLLDVDRDNYEYPSADIILAKVEGKNRDEFKPVLDPSVKQHEGSVFGARSVYATKEMKLDIPAGGEYLIRIKVRGKETKTPYTLSAYSPIKFKFEKSRVRKDFMPQLLQNIAQKNALDKVQDDGKMTKGNYLHCFYVYLANEDKRRTWNVTLKFDELENLRIAKKYLKGNPPNTLQFKIPPSGNAFAYLKQDAMAKGTSYKWSFSSAFN